MPILATPGTCRPLCSHADTKYTPCKGARWRLAALAVGALSVRLVSCHASHGHQCCKGDLINGAPKENQRPPVRTRTRVLLTAAHQSLSLRWAQHTETITLSCVLQKQNHRAITAKAKSSPTCRCLIPSASSNTLCTNSCAELIKRLLKAMHST